MSVFVAIFVGNFILAVLYLIVFSFQIQAYLKKSVHLPYVPVSAFPSNSAAMKFLMNFEAVPTAENRFEKEIIRFRVRYYFTFAFARLSLLAAILLA